MFTNDPHAKSAGSIINRSNYELYFVQYIDGECSSEEAAAVEAFAAAHPDLQEELQWLMEAKLVPDNNDLASFDKTFLLKPLSSETIGDEAEVVLTAEEAALVSLLDNELPLAERTVWEKAIQTQPAVATLWQQLQATKLEPDLTVVYPNKETLLRHTGKVRRLGIWRYAAAAAVIGFWVYQFPFGGTPNAVDKVAQNENSTKSAVAPGKPDAKSATPAEVVENAGSAAVQPPVLANNGLAAVTTTPNANATAVTKAVPAVNAITPTTENSISVVTHKTAPNPDASNNAVAKLDLPPTANASLETATEKAIPEAPALVTPEAASYVVVDMTTADDRIGNRKNRGKARSIIRTANRLLERTPFGAVAGAKQEPEALYIANLAIPLQ